MQVEPNIKKQVPCLSVAAFEGITAVKNAIYTNGYQIMDNATNAAVLSGAELFDMNVQEIDYLIQDLIPRVGIWSLVGSSDTGKSMLLRELIIKLARKQKFLNKAISGITNKAIFISSEDDEAATSYLIRKQAGTKDFLENISFYFDIEKIPDFLIRQLETSPVDLIILDAWSDIFGQDLKETHLTRQTLNIYRKIATDFKCSIGFLHHTGKRTEKLEPSKNNILAGQGFEAKMRLVMELRTDLSNERIRHLCIVKGNYLGKEHKQSSFVLDFDPETFRFSDTGDRTPFEQLIPQNQQNKAKTTPFKQFNEEVHKELILKIFKEHEHLKYAELTKALGVAYEARTEERFGRDRSQSLITYHTQETKFIKASGKTGARIYECNI